MTRAIPASATKWEMWLLHTESLRLRRFDETPNFPYAVLSHRWVNNEEITFQLMSEAGMVDDDRLLGADVAPNPRSSDRRRLNLRGGWRKISAFCRKARKRGLVYAWVDTCCINKESSAELQEAINSMYSWYKEAQICLVYMNDVPKVQFQDSEWFTRGWTLQELLAPDHLIFFDANWDELGGQMELIDQICKATRISRDAMKGPGRRLYIKRAPIAEKMSWVSERKTTRHEDMAYCLLGLFNVNMPLIYGEGLKQAFQRLQFCILSEGIDETIFVWNHPDRPREQGQVLRPDLGMLASRPSRFRPIDGFDGSSIVPYETKSDVRPPYHITNHGMRLQLRLYRYKDLDQSESHDWIPKHWEDRILVSPLRCRVKGTAKSVFICLVKIEGAQEWYRRVGHWIAADTEDLKRRRPEIKYSEVILVLWAIHLDTGENENALISKL